MNKNATSREEILRVGKGLLLEGGPDAVSMRAVASGCQVAVGAPFQRGHAECLDCEYLGGRF